MRRALVLVSLLVVGSACGLSSDHSEPHGTPIGVEQVEFVARGAFVGETGEPNLVTSADCRPGEDGNGEEPNVHFQCEIDFADGDSLSGLVHVLEQDRLVIDE